MKYLITLTLLASCASNPKLLVKTKQEKATVSYFNRDTLNYEVLGETPLEIGPRKSGLSKMQINSMAVLKVEKPGYVSENILIPGDRLGTTEVVLDLKQNTQWLKKDNVGLNKLAEDIASELYQVNSLSTGREYGQALEKVGKLINNYPSVAIFYDIKGSLHLLRDEKDLARQSFRKSVELKPGNLKTKELLERLNQNR